jgi:hypothetical protein
METKYVVFGKKIGDMEELENGLYKVYQDAAKEFLIDLNENTVWTKASSASNATLFSREKKKPAKGTGITTYKVFLSKCNISAYCRL